MFFAGDQTFCHLGDGGGLISGGGVGGFEFESRHRGRVARLEGETMDN